MNERQIKKLFTDRKADLPDDGFTERVLRQLPERRSRFPQVVMAVCIAIGLALTVAAIGLESVLEQFEVLAASMARMETPPLGAMAVYFAVLAMAGMIGYSLTRVEC
jgi:hypothetical protein